MQVDSLEDSMANAFEGRGGIQLWRSKPRKIDDDMSNAGTSSSTLIKLNWSMVKLSLLSLSAAPRLIVRWRFHEAHYYSLAPFRIRSGTYTAI